MVSKREENSRSRLLRKIVEPEYNNRIVQWIHWNALAREYPDEYKVERLKYSQDFVLLRWSDERSMWYIFQLSDKYVYKPNLKVIKRESS